VKASDLEFRRRFWVIGAIFWLGFSCGRWDPVNAADAIAQGLGAAGVPWSALVRRLILWLGAAVVGAGALVRSWAEAYLRSAVVHDPSLHADRLVADGPYRRVRNPLYLGLLLLAVGLGLLASRLGFVVIVAGQTLFVLRLIGREEDALLRAQGESYRAYRAAVPRLLPASRALVPAGDGRPDWREGLLGETFCWSFAAGMAAVAATDDMRAFASIAGAGFAVYFFQHLARRR
jgi:protein-S-isoprenylcysteine O-methyltransferase Ste14